MRRILLALIAITIAIGVTNAHALDPPPTLGRWVVDNAGLLTRRQETQLADTLRAIEQDTGGRGTGAQVAVLTMKSLRGDDIKDFALRTFQAWKLGARDTARGGSNGVLILVVKDTARVRIEVGKGLEGVLNDGKVGSIIRENFTGPHKPLAGALADTINQIASAIRAEAGVSGKAAPSRGRATGQEHDSNGDARLVLFGASIFIAGILGAIFHRRRRMLRYWFGGAVGGVSWLGIAAHYALIGAALWGVAVLGYVFGYLLSAFFRHGGDGWLFDPFPYPVPGGGGGGGLHGGGGDAGGGGADGGVDPGLFDGLGDAVSGAVPTGDCPDLGGCDPGGCDIGGC